VARFAGEEVRKVVAHFERVLAGTTIANPGFYKNG
jgi:hypothetical protein